MWRKGLSLLALGLAVGVVLFAIDSSPSVDRAVSTGLAAVYMMTANYSYYLHRVKQSQSWNPFEVYGRKKPVS